MQRIIPRLIGAVTVCIAAAFQVASAALQAEAEYQLVRKDADTAIVTRTGAGAVELDMRFIVFFATQSPEMSLRNASTPGLRVTLS